MLPLKFSSKMIHSITAQTGLTQRTNLVHSGSSANISCQMGLCKSGRTDPNLVCQWRAAMAGKVTSITAGKFKHQLNLKCSWNSLGMFSNHHWWKITRIWITRCLCEGQNIPCLFFFSIALEEKKPYKSNCTPGTVWIVISRTSAPPAVLWSTTCRHKSLIRAERELQENPNQPNQRRWQLCHQESKPKMPGVAEPAQPRSSSSGGTEAPPLLLGEGISQLCQGMDTPRPAVKPSESGWEKPLCPAVLSPPALDTANLNGSTGNDLPQWIISVLPVHRVFIVCAQGNIKQLLVCAWI